MPDADLKRSGHGSFQEKTAYVGDTQLHAVKWYDNRSANLLINYVGAHPVYHVDRTDGKEAKGKPSRSMASWPSAVSTYNQYMGGVDLLDSPIALYRINIRSKKWYHRLVCHLIDIVMVTCWLIYRPNCADNEMKRDVTICPFMPSSSKLHTMQSQKKARKKGRTSGGISQQYEEKRRKQGPMAPIPNRMSTGTIPHAGK